MELAIQRRIAHWYVNLVQEGNSLLFYGKPAETVAVMQEIYTFAKDTHSLSCSWHDASRIQHPLDFFDPILQLKYGSQYQRLDQFNQLKDLFSRNDKTMPDISILAELCQQEKQSPHLNAQKLPVIFVDGMEELLFRMDYAHLDAPEQKAFSKGVMEQPSPKGFGNCLRANLHQTKRGVFCGTVKNPDSLQYQATLGNYNYLFYAENFRPVHL